MDRHHAQTLVERERRRIEAALAGLAADDRSENDARLDQAGESKEAGADLQFQMTDDAVAANLRDELAAVERAEARIADGTYGLSIESGARIPDARLEVQPLAERTVEEQGRFEHRRS